MSTALLKIALQSNYKVSASSGAIAETTYAANWLKWFFLSLAYLKILENLRLVFREMPLDLP